MGRQGHLPAAAISTSNVARPLIRLDGVRDNPAAIGGPVLLRSEDPTRIPLYAVAEAATLAGVHPISARRWLEGYDHTYKGERRRSPSKVGDAVEIDGVLLVSFQDLIELRVAGALRRFGVPWRTVRAAADALRETWSARRPFAIEKRRRSSVRATCSCH